MNDLVTIDLSSVEHKLDGTAFDLFRFWTDKAQLTDIIIKDEQLLVNDLRTTLCDALQSLQKEDHADKPMDWDVGFVMGFVSGHLGTKWHHNYVVRSSEVYKTYAGLKAIQSYFKFDELTRLKVEELYKYMLSEDYNVDFIEPDIAEKDLSLEDFEEVTTRNHGKILTILNNLVIRQVSLVVKVKNDISIPVEDFFLGSDIRHLISSN